MSISEVSNNLFKNYYPCILPEYYQDQISEQIIQNQLDKLISNFITEKKRRNKKEKDKDKSKFGLFKTTRGKTR